ncbi:MAG: thioredoxin domain-containing protein [Syntrophales bacterium]|nr:thioredoxin domain-containing protein [Syntrophales bacterium]
MFHVKQTWLIVFFLSGVLLFSRVSGEQIPPLPHWGAGKCEVFIFSDYFCLPCQRLERDLEPLVRRLVHNNRIRLCFIDLPLYPLTPLYTKYFLRAVNEETSFDHALAIRRFLFDLASRLSALKEEHLEREFKARKISLPFFYNEKIESYIDHLAKGYGIKSVPTCVVACPDEPLRILRGQEEILTILRSFQDYAE